jgi:hypothetical protein
MAIEFIHTSHYPVLEFLFGCEADMDSTEGKLGEEAIDESKPRTVHGREGEFEEVDRG